MRRFVFAACFVLLMAIPHIARAKLAIKIAGALAENYPAAEPHSGLETAHDQPDSGKMRGYVVVLRGGIPAERARFFISWEDYDYRGVVVHLGGDENVTTRRGSAYAYLQRGDVMAIAEVKEFNRTIYFRLQSADIYVPENRQQEKRHSRVTVMLGFKFPNVVFKNDDADEVLKGIGEWLRPFPNVDEAKSYAAAIREAPAASAAESAAAQTPDATAEEARIKGLEEKIEDARRQMEEAEREMDKLKRDRRGSK